MFFIHNEFSNTLDKWFKAWYTRQCFELMDCSPGMPDIVFLPPYRDWHHKGFWRECWCRTRNRRWSGFRVCLIAPLCNFSSLKGVVSPAFTPPISSCFLYSCFLTLCLVLIDPPVWHRKVRVLRFMVYWIVIPKEKVGIYWCSKPNLEHPHRQSVTAVYDRYVLIWSYWLKYNAATKLL